MSADRKVTMEARLETSPKRPRLENKTPSHQNSNCFHTWASISIGNKIKLDGVGPVDNRPSTD